VLTEGNVIAAAAIIICTTIIILTFYRLDYGFLLFVGMVLLFDQYPPRGFDKSIIGFEYFQNLKYFPLFSSIDLAAINPIELQLGLLLIIWALLIVMGKQVFLQPIPVWLAALMFFLWLTISAVYGIGRGGDFLPALWELRALFYFGILFFFVPQVIQSKEQLQKLMWVCILAISFKVVQGVVRLVRLGFNFGERTELTNHEDPLFFISLFVLLFGFVVFGCSGKQRRFLLWSLLPMFIVFILAQRRATYVALGVALVAFIILLPGKERLTMLKVIAPLLVIAGLYLAAFWNSESSIGLPAQLVKSSFSVDQKGAGERYYSNLYREFENYNLAMTLKKSPVIGIGFGNKYDQPISLTFIPFSLRDYIPHNEIFWLAVKMGGVGFFLFWFFFDAFVFQAAFVFAHLRDPYLKTICAVSMIAILCQIVVSYVDLQLTFYRNMIYLGVLMGLLPTLKMLDTKNEETPLVDEKRPLYAL
ncbi:MAG: O-antigen ligase family protein, partial [Ignavibacteriales bacterium]|nr:O-antigen ligase family protein [Ignavibacteriales bacterium]